MRITTEHKFTIMDCMLKYIYLNKDHVSFTSTHVHECIKRLKEICPTVMYIHSTFKDRMYDIDNMASFKDQIDTYVESTGMFTIINQGSESIYILKQRWIDYKEMMLQNKNVPYSCSRVKLVPVRYADIIKVVLEPFYSAE